MDPAHGIARIALLLALLGPLAAGQALAQGLSLVGHLGGVSAEEDIDGLDDLDWTTGVADLAVESSLFGPLHVGVGGEFLLDTDELSVTSREAGFAYAKVRLPLPFSPYGGLGLELRRAEVAQDDGSFDSGWHRGRLLLLGAGLKLSRVSLDLEFRATRTDIDGTVLKLYSIRPGLTVWL